MRSPTGPRPVTELATETGRERRRPAPHPARARERWRLCRGRAGRLRQHGCVRAAEGGRDARPSPTSSAASGIVPPARSTPGRTRSPSSTPTAATSGRGSPRIRRSEPHSTGPWCDGLERRVERLAALDWRGDETVVDVGGGNGSLLAALLARQPGLRGIVFDLPETVRDEASARRPDRVRRRQLLRERAARRCVRPLDGTPQLADEQAAAILRTIRAAAPDHGRLLVIDAVMPPGNEPDGTQWFDLLGLALFGSRERDEAQWRELSRGHGFRARADPRTA